MYTHEEVVSGHAWLSGHTSRDDDDVTVLQGLLGAVVGREEAGDLRGRSDVRQVGRDLGR